MRICHVIESSSGGSSQVVIGLLRAQLAGGDDVTLIYSPVRAEPPFLDAIADLGPRLHRLELPMQRNVGWRDLRAALALRSLLKRHGPFDIVHGHSSKAGALLRLACAFLPGPAVVYTPHAFVTMAPDANRAYGVVEWLASWFCDAVTVGSQQELDHARVLRLPESRLKLVPMGVDLAARTDSAAARAELGLPPDGFVVGFIGRIVAQKNPDRLAKAFGIVAKRLPVAHFVVVGDGDLRDDFTAAMAANGLLDRVVIRPHPKARDIVCAFDVLVCASDYESFGLIFAEALAAGVPVVSPPVGVAEEAVGDGEAGRIAGFDAASIAAGIAAVAALDETEKAQMAKACIARAKRFDFAVTAARFRALYDDLIPRAGR